ncbi:MAG: F0F1 ATP synthase subunit B [Candidatus Dormibacteraceae bacterium]
MLAITYLDSAGLLTINGTILVEIIAFVAMVLICAKWIYPPVVRAAEQRQRQIVEQLDRARQEREEASRQLKQVGEQLQQARQQASEIVAGAGKDAEQMRGELRRRAEVESERIVQNARRDIEAERVNAVSSVRGEVAELVVRATERVVGESLDGPKHHKLIEQVIEQLEQQESNGARS